MKSKRIATLLCISAAAFLLSLGACAQKVQQNNHVSAKPSADDSEKIAMNPVMNVVRPSGRVYLVQQDEYSLDGGAAGVIFAPETAGRFPMIVLSGWDAAKQDALAKRLAACGFIAASAHTEDIAAQTDALTAALSGRSSSDLLISNARLADGAVMVAARGGAVGGAMNATMGRSAVRAVLAVFPKLEEKDIGAWRDVAVSVLSDEQSARAGELMYSVLTGGRRGNVTALTYLRDECNDDFLFAFAADFAELTLKSGTPRGVYDHKLPEPCTMYGKRVSTKCVYGFADRLTMRGGKITASNASVRYVQKSGAPEKDELKEFPAHVYGTAELMQAVWPRSGGSITFSVDEQYSNLTRYACLQIIAAQNPSDPMNERGAAQPFMVALTDNAGKKAYVAVGEKSAAIAFPDGEPAWRGEKDARYQAWSCAVPISMVRVPLSMFEGIALKSIASVSLIFDRTDMGDLIIEGIYAD